MTNHFATGLALSLLAFAASGCCCIDRPYCPTGCGDHVAAEYGGGCESNCHGCSLGQHVRNQLGGCAGCGDVYWGEWTSDPPDNCDPCDGCGHWIGPRCCPPRLFDFLTCSLSDLWGSRCCDTGGGGCEHGSGCSSCGGGDPGPWDGMEFDEGAHHSSKPNEPRRATPIPQNGPTKARPDSQDLPQPMAEPQALHSRNLNHAPTKALHTQPTRSKRPSYQHSSASRTRQRSL